MRGNAFVECAHRQVRALLSDQWKAPSAQCDTVCGVWRGGEDGAGDDSARTTYGPQLRPQLEPHWLRLLGCNDGDSLCTAVLVHLPLALCAPADITLLLALWLLLVALRPHRWLIVRCCHISLCNYEIVSFCTDSCWLSAKLHVP